MMGLEGEWDKARLATELFTLATNLKEDSKWREATEEALSEPSTLAIVSSVLKTKGKVKGLVKKAEEKKSTEEDELSTITMDQVMRIDQMLEKVSNSLAKSNLEPAIAEVTKTDECCRNFPHLSIL